MNLVDKIIKMGVSFPDGIPTRWHFFHPGDTLGRTQLCYEVVIGRKRVQLDEYVKWEYMNCKGCFVEAEFPIKMLLKNEIELVVNQDPDYGTCVLEIQLKKGEKK